MTIRPVDLNGMMQRSQEVGALKQNEDNKPVFDQQLIAATYTKKNLHEAHQINETEQKAGAQGHFDAREEGKNKYQDNRKKKDNKQVKGSTVTKKGQSSGFDVKI